MGEVGHPSRDGEADLPPLPGSSGRFDFSQLLVPEPPSRRELWMEGARRHLDQVRRARRTQLASPSAAASWRAAISAVRKVSALGDDPGETLVRSALIFKNETDPGARRVLGLDDAGRRIIHEQLSPSEVENHPNLLANTVRARMELAPPMAKLAHRGGPLPARLYLSALYVAGCLRSSASPWRNPLPNGRPDGHYPPWIEIVGEWKTDRAAREPARRRLTKALIRLDQLRMCQPAQPDVSSRGRWDRWQLNREDGVGALYAAPSGGLRLATNFFLEGWPLVLTAQELACYLMFVHAAQTQRWLDHRDGGTGIRHDRRLEHYGITDEAYETHNTLTEFGLLTRRPDTIADRRAGKVPAFRGKPVGSIDVYRFDVVPLTGLNDARQVMLDALENPVPRLEEYRQLALGNLGSAG